MSSAEASRELKPLADGQWEFNVKASALLVTQRERSRFHFANGGIRPDSYRYLRELFGHQRRVDLTFDWRRKRGIGRGWLPWPGNNGRPTAAVSWN